MLSPQGHHLCRIEVRYHEERYFKLAQRPQRPTSGLPLPNTIFYDPFFFDMCPRSPNRQGKSKEVPNASP